MRNTSGMWMSYLDDWHPNFSRDRHKLTFYYITEKRIDFRELVRELFRYVPLETVE